MLMNTKFLIIVGLLGYLIWRWSILLLIGKKSITRIPFMRQRCVFGGAGLAVSIMTAWQVNAMAVSNSVSIIDTRLTSVMSTDINQASSSSNDQITNKKSVSLCWEIATANAPWTARSCHSVLAYNNRLWILGGFEDDMFYGERDEVWYSTDGIEWNLALAKAPWGRRGDHSSVVFDDKMWIIGGVNADFLSVNDVWFSENGVDWTQATENASWIPRNMHQSFVFDSKMWVLGGINDGSMYLYDIWCSSDGMNWTCATDDPEWGILDGFSVVAFQDKMWVMAGYNHTGGYLVGAVWSSVDGTHWTYEGDCGWGSDHTAVVAGGSIWLMGGNYGGYWTNGVWYSPDGTNWAQATCNSHWSPRIRHASVAFDGKIWVLGGLYAYGTGDVLNDVWYAEVFNAHFSGVPVTDTAPLTVQFTDDSISVLETITSWLWDFGDGTTSTEQHPEHTYALRGLYDVSLTVTSASNTDIETKTIHVASFYHSADINQDHKISLSELLRMIQFYNLGGLHCASGTEDGYAPGLSPDKGLPPLVSKADLSRRSETKTDCDLHASDYNPPDWTINMSELLRIIQLFRSPSYYPCIDGEDGFCVD